MLPIYGDWNNDGSVLPIEFARESNDGRITLVLVDDQHTVPCLWALLDVVSLSDAKKALARREGISDKNINYSIGCIDRNTAFKHGKCAKTINKWAADKDLDCVVWTNLKYGLICSRDSMPSASSLLSHIEGLSPDQRIVTEEYVKRAPKQVKTHYREIFEETLGWWQKE